MCPGGIENWGLWERSIQISRKEPDWVRLMHCQKDTREPCCLWPWGYLVPLLCGRSVPRALGSMRSTWNCGCQRAEGVEGGPQTLLGCLQTLVLQFSLSIKWSNKVYSLSQKMNGVRLIKDFNSGSIQDSFKSFWNETTLGDIYQEARLIKAYRRPNKK